jgi:hypothetical protein
MVRNAEKPEIVAGGQGKTSEDVELKVKDFHRAMKMIEEVGK